MTFQEHERKLEKESELLWNLKNAKQICLLSWRGLFLTNLERRHKHNAHVLFTDLSISQENTFKCPLSSFLILVIIHVSVMTYDISQKTNEHRLHMKKATVCLVKTSYCFLIQTHINVTEIIKRIFTTAHWLDETEPLIVANVCVVYHACQVQRV